MGSCTERFGTRAFSFGLPKTAQTTPSFIDLVITTIRRLASSLSPEPTNPCTELPESVGELGEEGDGTPFSKLTRTELDTQFCTASELPPMAALPDRGWREDSTAPFTAQPSSVETPVREPFINFGPRKLLTWLSAIPTAQFK